MSAETSDGAPAGGARARFLAALGHRSIARRISFGLAVMAAATLIAVALGLLVFSQVRRDVGTITGHSLPALTVAAGLSNTAIEIKGDARALTMSSEWFARDTIALRLRAHMDRLGDYENRLAALDVDAKTLEDLADARQVLDGDLSKLGAAVSRMIEAQKSLSTTTADATGLCAAVLAPPQPANGDWVMAINRACRNLLSGMAFAEPALVNQARKQVSLDIAAADAVATVLPDDRVASYLALRALAIGDNPLLTRRLTELSLRLAVSSALGRAIGATERLEDRVSAVATGLEAGVSASAADLDIVLDDRSRWLVGLGGACVLVTLGMLVYVRRALVQRLSHMQAALRDHLSGRPTAMPTSGDDEIGDIGRALDYFIGEITERETALRAARDQAEAATQAKGAFLANMSHEIRTPMNAILGMGHLLARTPLTDQQQDYQQKIIAAAENLLGIINDILDFSKIEANRLDLERAEFDLDTVLSNMAALLAQRAEERGVEFLLARRPSIPGCLVGDALRLGQILINLATNAIKFTETGEVVVAVDMVEEDADGLVLRFSVQDSGIGMTAEQLGRLFQPFSQADVSTTRRYGGTGLGLAICKRLVDLMDGEIGAVSEPGKGSTFHFTARFGKATGQAAVAAPMAPAIDGHRRRVLVVDDNETARTILRDLLTDFNLNVRPVPSGEAALEELRRASEHNEAPYNLVLMDWQMPGMDGVEAVRRIRADRRLAETPAMIMVTAFSRADLLACVAPDEMDGVLLKPFNPSTLFDIIAGAMDVKSRKQGLGDGGGIGDTGRAIDAAGRSATAPPPRLSGRLLLAEDNAVNQQIARELLAQAGLQVEVVDNGRDAVARVAAEVFDAVLMDIQMPVMDGYEATEIIRRRPDRDSLPIIAMTAHAMDGDRDRCLAVGMNDHVSKPIDPATLYATLARWLPDKADPGAAPAVATGTSRTTDPAAQPLDLPGLDTEAGVARVVGNRALYRRLLVDFRSEHGQAAAIIADRLATGDRAEAARLVHAVKGVAGNLGAVDLMATGSVLETALHSDAPLHPALDDFTAAFAIVMDGIAALGARPGPATPAPPGGALDAAAAAALLEALAARLGEGSPRAGDVIADLRQVAGGQFDAELAALETAVNAYDFDHALDLAGALDARLQSMRETTVG